MALVPSSYTIYLKDGSTMPNKAIGHFVHETETAFFVVLKKTKQNVVTAAISKSSGAKITEDVPF